MILQHLNKQQIQEAKANEGNLPKKLTPDVSGNLYKNRLGGCIGEVAASAYLESQLQHYFEFDLIYNGHKIDVKTIIRSVRPMAHYACRITIHSHIQDCDIYLFACAVHKDRCFYPSAYLCGWASKQEVEQWETVKKGDAWPEAPNKKERSDAYKSTYSALRPIQDLKNIQHHGS